MGEGVHTKRVSKTAGLRKGTERLARKGDINAGLTEAQRIGLTKAENKYRNYKTERSYVIDKNGKEIPQINKGTKNRTRVWAPADSVITHNHPSGKNGRATRYGTSLSGADVYAAISFNAAEIRAVGGTHTYSVRRPKQGWPVSANKYISEWNQARDRHSIRLTEYMKGAKNIADIARRYQRANTLMSHLATKEMAKKYNLKYTRRRTE